MAKAASVSHENFHLMHMVDSPNPEEERNLSQMLYREHTQKLSKTLQDTKTTTQRQVTMNPLKIALTGLQKTLKESWGNKTKGETM